MKRQIQKIGYFFCLIFAFQILFLPGSVQAKENRTYTVTLRAGNAGTFVTEDTDGIFEMENVEYTSNYIRITVEKGETLADATGEIWTDDKALNAWCEKNIKVNNSKDRTYAYKPFAEKISITTTPVEKNTEYVADYVRIVKEEKKHLTVTEKDEKWWQILLRYLSFSTR